MVKAVALVRVSSTQQDYSRQISDLMPLITGDGYSQDEIAVVKHKESASKLNVSNRKTIQDLIDIINNNQVESVYVTEISRLSRRSDVLYSVLALLEERQIALVVQTPTVIRTYKRNGDKWERDAFAHIIIQFLEQAAVNEIENKTARQKSGYLQKQKDGKVVSSKVVFGYTRDKDGYAVVNDAQAKIVNDIFESYVNGESVGTLWDKYNHTQIFPQLSTKSGNGLIGKILRNRTYIGDNQYFKYPKIVSNELFELAQSKLDSNKLVKVKLNFVYYCQGIIRIYGHCMTPNCSQCTYSYRDCDRKLTYGININMVDSLAWGLAAEAKASMNQTADKARIDSIHSQLEVILSKIEGIKVDIESNQKEQDRYISIFGKGKLSEDKFDFEMERLEGELNHLLKTQEQLNINRNQLEAALTKSDMPHMQGVVDYNNIISIEDDNIKRDIIKETIESINLTLIEKGKYRLDVDYVDKSLNNETYYIYQQTGPKLHLYCVYGDMYEDWSNILVKRIKPLWKRKKESTN